MKRSMFYFAFLIMALFGRQKGMPAENDFAIFFETINYKGKSFFIYPHLSDLNLFRFFKAISIWRILNRMTALNCPKNGKIEPHLY